MVEVWNLIYSIFEDAIHIMKSIPVFHGVSLYHFLLALTILTIVITAFVPVVTSGSVNYGESHEIYNKSIKTKFKNDEISASIKHGVRHK